MTDERRRGPVDRRERNSSVNAIYGRREFPDEQEFDRRGEDLPPEPGDVVRSTQPRRRSTDIVTQTGYRRKINVTERRASYGNKPPIEEPYIKPKPLTAPNPKLPMYNSSDNNFSHVRNQAPISHNNIEGFIDDSVDQSTHTRIRNAVNSALEQEVPSSTPELFRSNSKRMNLQERMGTKSGLLGMGITAAAALYKAVEAAKMAYDKEESIGQKNFKIKKIGGIKGP